ncbi:MAG TPA: protein kinase [Polyangiales bacterium]|nr:protein kinase [Polyangiales bacterium]
MLDSDRPPARTHTRRGALTIGGRYQVVAELGRGGMGVVYRVRDPASGRELALKQLLVREDGQHSRQAISLFEREFNTLAQLAHPRVIAVYDYGIDAAGPFYTMELLDGGDLKALSPMPARRACELLIDVCSSLALLHARRWVHRDITPRNIRCTRDGHAKLIDFGAMVPMGPCPHAVGTAAFMAPEVLHHSTVDARTDLFSLGATLYYALTGQPPFEARKLAELRDAWSAEFVPPSSYAADIPPALDALCASLLRIDPVHRPRSVFEVMQRLGAVAGVEIEEPQSVAQAYLTAPALTGREDTLQRFRHCMRRALHGEGAALLLECAPGLGRTRALDACVLEAKTLGASVLRTTANTSAEEPFAVAAALLEQLHQLQPEVSLQAAAAARVRDVLFEADGRGYTLRALQGLERAAVHNAVTAWIAQLCESQALLMAVDDVRRADEASLALLAALAVEAKELRLVVAVTADSSELEHTPQAFKVLEQYASRLMLRPLNREQTEALLSSMFGNVPNLPLLAERVFQVALGNPRDSLEFARHLVERGRIRYEDGRWSLPAELDATELPASSAEALEARIAALPQLARRLAEAQALAGNVMRRRDYALLAPDASGSALDAAINSLLQQQIVQSDGERFRLNHRALSEALLRELAPAQKRERHLALYELYRAQPDMHPYLIVHHLFEADQPERALDLLAQHETLGAERDSEAAVRAGFARLAGTFHRALELTLRLGRPRREAFELRRKLCSMAGVSDDVVYERIMPEWFAQLEHDSGLLDYRALDSGMDANTRLQRALTAAGQRYAATAESERVYRVDEAIKHLAVYVVSSISISSKALDVRAARALPGVLEPFAPLSPALFAIWQNALALNDLMAGRYVSARDRWRDVYERLGRVAPDAVRFVVNIRAAVLHAVLAREALMGRSTVVDLANELEPDAMSAAGVMSARRMLCLMHGDTEGAEYFGKQVELVSLRRSAQNVYEPHLDADLLAYCTLRDLAGVRRVADATRPRAGRRPGWRGLLLVADGNYALLRGDLTGARSAFSQAEELARPDGTELTRPLVYWIDAVLGGMAVCMELGELDRAVDLGRQALAMCDEHRADLIRLRVLERLALAEGKRGEHARAAARLDEVIESYRALEMRGVIVAHCYVTRVRIAIWARDAAAVARFTASAAAEPGGEKVLAAALSGEPVGAEARRAGVELALGRSAFESSVLGSVPAPAASPQASKFSEALLGCADAAARGRRALELLCELTQCEHGQLYLVDAAGELRLAAATPAAPSAHAVQFARGFFAQQIDDHEFTAGLTHATQMLSLPGAAAYIDERGHAWRLYVLTCKDRGRLVYVGLGVLAVNTKLAVDVQLTAQLTLLASCLLRTGDTPGLAAG